MKPEQTTSSDFRRILWRCRRGTRELDLVLGSFARLCYGNLQQSEKELFSELLEQQDTQLTSWLVYHELPEDRFAALVSRILNAGFANESG